MIKFQINSWADFFKIVSENPKALLEVNLIEPEFLTELRRCSNSIYTRINSEINYGPLSDQEVCFLNLLCLFLESKYKSINIYSEGNILAHFEEIKHELKNLNIIYSWGSRFAK